MKFYRIKNKNIEHIINLDKITFLNLDLEFEKIIIFFNTAGWLELYYNTKEEAQQEFDKLETLLQLNV